MWAFLSSTTTSLSPGNGSTPWAGAVSSDPVTLAKHFEINKMMARRLIISLTSLNSINESFLRSVRRRARGCGSYGVPLLRGCEPAAAAQLQGQPGLSCPRAAAGFCPTLPASLGHYTCQKLKQCRKLSCQLNALTWLRAGEVGGRTQTLVIAVEMWTKRRWALT